MKFLPNGVRTLAEGALPGGQRFSIFYQHYRFEGHTYVDLSLATRGGGGSFRPAQTPGPISFSSFGECSHPSLSIVYGLLRDTRDWVTLSSRTIARPLSRTTIPGRLNARGVLVFGFTYTPATLTLKSHSGRVAESVALPSTRTFCSRRGALASVSTSFVERRGSYTRNRHQREWRHARPGSGSHKH